MELNQTIYIRNTEQNWRLWKCYLSWKYPWLHSSMCTFYAHRGASIRIPPKT